MSISSQENKTDIQKLIDASKIKNYRGLRINPRYYDKEIYNIINVHPSAIHDIDHEYLIACFINGLNHTLMHILNHHKDRGRILFSKGNLEKHRDDRYPSPKNPLVNIDFKASELVILKVLEVCCQQIEENLQERNRRRENVLHILIRHGYGIATQYVVDRYEDILDICFHTDEDGMTPLMSALSKNSIKQEELLVKLWSIMVDSNKKEIIDVIR